MSIGIYKIQNLINGKIYIGKSVHIQKRWIEHCKPSANSAIANAIKKYGKENFSFQIIAQCSQEELNSLQAKYIKQYNSITPYGYNIVLEDDSYPTVFNKYNLKDFQNIINDLKYSSLSVKQIANKYSLDLSMVYYLNKGDYHYLKNQNYPLREVLDMSKKHHYCIDCGKEIGKGALRCQECGHLIQRRCERPSREQLKFLIRNLPFTKIGEKYGVTDNSIRKWCKAVNLPYQKTKIKNFSDQEWEQI